METFGLVCLEWLSAERDKHIWEDLYGSSWDEIIGRMYLLKAHDTMGSVGYKASLADFKQALALLKKDGVDQGYYLRALNDKALVQCFLGKTKAALETMDQALTVSDPTDPDDDLAYRKDILAYRDDVLANRAAVLVLAGAYSEALQVLTTLLTEHPKDYCLRLTQATCLLHMERYEEAVAAYERAIAEGSPSHWADEGLKAARLGQQPDWDEL